MNVPVFLVCATGFEHLVYCIWLVRSLRRFDYEAIEILVSSNSERDFLLEHLGAIDCSVVHVDLSGYRMWAFRPFALEKYRIKHEGRPVVVCDTDIIWHHDPRILFERFVGKAWVHKITSLNPSDLDIQEAPPNRIGLRTMLAYKKHAGLSHYLNFHLNCGLFMVPEKDWKPLIRGWCKAIRSVPPQDMIMTEALLSIVFAQQGLEPCSDVADVKHHGIPHDDVSGFVVRYHPVQTPECSLTGYQTATHYFGDQRPKLYNRAQELGLDPEGLAIQVSKRMQQTRFKRVMRRRFAGLLGYLGIKRGP